MGETLKPCPFCGGEASIWTTGAYSCDSADHVLGCEKCDIYTPFASVFQSSEPTKQDAHAWNTRDGDLIPRDEITPQMAAEVLLRHFTSDDCETDFKPAWAAFRKCLWEHDGSIYSAMASFLRALTAIKEKNDD